MRDKKTCHSHISLTFYNSFDQNYMNKCNNFYCIVHSMALKHSKR